MCACVRVCASARACMRAMCVCVCERDILREIERDCVSAYVYGCVSRVCVSARDRERVCACVFVYTK